VTRYDHPHGWRNEAPKNDVVRMACQVPGCGAVKFLPSILKGEIGYPEALQLIEKLTDEALGRGLVVVPVKWGTSGPRRIDLGDPDAVLVYETSRKKEVKD